MRYVALLRGINVGGNTMISMAELKESFASVGFENVVSYINSGNLAFDTRKTGEAKLVDRIESAIEKDFGLKVQVMVREQKKIEHILANNPYVGEYESHKEMHVLFLKSELSDKQKQLLADAVPSGERFMARGREIYCHLPMGVAESYLGRGKFEKMLKVSVTARNWRTVRKLAEL
ncbi:MAG TPA: DUF1697 domain-containing protein [Pyrinomonadaceae bacterium]